MPFFLRQGGFWLTPFGHVCLIARPPKIADFSHPCLLCNRSVATNIFNKWMHFWPNVQNLTTIICKDNKNRKITSFVTFLIIYIIMKSSAEVIERELNSELTIITCKTRMPWKLFQNTRESTLDNQFDKNWLMVLFHFSLKIEYRSHNVPKFCIHTKCIYICIICKSITHQLIQYPSVA